MPLHAWAPTSLSPKLRMPQDHRVRRRHSLQLRGSCSKSLHLPRGETLSPSPAFGAFSALTPDPEHTNTLPKARAAAGPGRGRLARKVPAGSSTSSSPRAREHLYATLCTSESALRSVRARAHSHLHAHTHFHAFTYTFSAGPKTCALLLTWDLTVKLSRLNFLHLFLKSPLSLLLSPQYLPPKSHQD